MSLMATFRKLIVRNKSSAVSLDYVFGGREELWKSVGCYKDIPGPKGLPFIGNSWRFIPFIGQYEVEHLDKVSKALYEEYGDIVKVDGLLGKPDMLFVFNPDEIENVFRQEDSMPLRPSMPSLNYYKHVYRKDFFGDEAGVIAVHGENWQKFRSKVNKILLQPRIAKMYMKPIEKSAMEFVERIEKIKNQDEEVPDNFLNEVHKWSLESIARVALDVQLGCLQDNCPEDTQILIDAVNEFFVNVPILELKTPFWTFMKNPMKYPTFKRYIGALETIRKICLKYINKSLENSKKLNCDEPSVLQRVLKMDNSVRTACILALDMFLVGIDTTSNSVASILYQLALHPEKQQILYEEIKREVGNEVLDEQKIENMSYLKACIKETMRKYPVVIGNGRTTKKDCIIGGYHIPKGVHIIFPHSVICTTDKFFDKSDKFLPERWLKNCPFHSKQDKNSSSSTKTSNLNLNKQLTELNLNKQLTELNLNKNHHPFASLPFGYGKRMCLGRRFAELEIQTVITKVIQTYKVEYHHELLDYHVHPMYTPNGPLKLKFIKRN